MLSRVGSAFYGKAMDVSESVRRILGYYNSENPGVITNLARVLFSGRLANSGRVLILPVDQGFEHGPVRSFEPNPDAYDPHYHFELALKCGFSAYAAPLGMLECGISKYAGLIPIILKVNSSTSLLPKSVQPNQAVTASVKDALRLGCVAIGLTIYPGSEFFLPMLSEARELIREAKSHGLAVVVWSYPRGSELSKSGETAIDIVAYAAYIAASIGANIIKVKLPTSHMERENIRCDVSSLAKRVAYVKRSCFAGRRMVVFSGGDAKSAPDLLAEAEAIMAGGGDGSIIGRNSFQRGQAEAVSLISDMVKVYS